jgi:hypothetical protein
MYSIFGFDELQGFLLLHELQVDRLGQPMFEQYIWFGYLIELKDELQGFLLLHELQVDRLGKPVFVQHLQLFSFVSQCRQEETSKIIKENQRDA